MTGSMLATVTDIGLYPDPARVIAKTFIPGLEDVGPTGSRAGAVVDRVLRMDDAQINDLLAELVARLGDRSGSS